MLTLTGWKKKIAEYCTAHGIVKSKGQVERMAIKIAKRAASMQEYDPDDLIRSVLTYADPTGDEACRRVMGVAA